MPSEENKKREKRRKFLIKRIGRKKKEKILNQRGGESKKERKFPDQRLRESKKKKKKRKKIPDQGSEENRRNIQKDLWTRQYLNNTGLSTSKQEKGNYDLKWSSPFDCRQNPVR